MRRLFRHRRMGKRGFTLMEVVIAIAVVGIISAMILPLASAAMQSFKAANALRTTAATAEADNAVKTNNPKETIYVKITLMNLRKADTNQPYDRTSEMRYSFTKTTATDSTYDIVVTYYELKYN